MEPQAIESGILATDYWSMTFDEIMLQCSANKKAKEREIKEKAMFDYNMIQGMMFAFNDPKNMPRAEKLYPMLEEKKEEVKQESKEIQPFDESANQALFMEIAKGVHRANQNKENSRR